MTKMVHGDFKPGEVCRASGNYQCRTCSSRSRTSRIRMEQGGTFPLCGSCQERGALEIDTVWKLAPGNGGRPDSAPPPPEPRDSQAA